MLISDATCCPCEVIESSVTWKLRLKRIRVQSNVEPAYFERLYETYVSVLGTDECQPGPVDLPDHASLRPRRIPSCPVDALTQTFATVSPVPTGILSATVALEALNLGGCRAAAPTCIAARSNTMKFTMAKPAKVYQCIWVTLQGVSGEVCVVISSCQLVTTTRLHLLIAPAVMT